MADWKVDSRTRPGSAALDGEAPEHVYGRIISGDVAKADAAIFASRPAQPSLTGIDRNRYVDPAFHHLEVERLWSKVWQMACREEEIPEGGDVVVYDIADTSFIVTRTHMGEIRAFRNACLHRGTRLCDGDTSVRQFRCPFHGFTWSLEGELTEVPCRWDFPHVDDDSFRLPEALVGTWGGFVFINMDPDAAPLEDYLGVMADHIPEKDFAGKYIAGYYRKVLPANWKACIEAFLEAYHSIETHSWSLGFTNDANAQYDIFPETPHVTRFMHAFGVQSPHIDRTLSEQEILEELYKIFWNGEPVPILPPRVKARAFAADQVRKRMTAVMGRDYMHVSDPESLDSIEYSLFPNFVLFKGIAVPTVYRFRPNGNDPDSCIFDLLLLADIPEGQPRPEAAPVLEMGDLNYVDAPGLNHFFGTTYDQDTSNLGMQQRGMKSMQQNNLVFARYQESRLRHFHMMIDRYLGIERPGSV